MGEYYLNEKIAYFPGIQANYSARIDELIGDVMSSILDVDILYVTNTAPTYSMIIQGYGEDGATEPIVLSNNITHLHGDITEKRNLQRGGGRPSCENFVTE